MINIDKIETERLILREFRMEDAQDVFNFGSNLKVNKFTGDCLLETLEEAKDIINNIYFKDYKNIGYGRWAVIFKPENKVIGFAGLKYLPELKLTDIGFRLLPEYWGKGITTEASKEIIKYGFETLKLDKIVGIVMPKNIASYKVLEKIDLKFYKFDSYYGSDEKYNWYQIFKEDYFKNI